MKKENTIHIVKEQLCDLPVNHKATSFKNVYLKEGVVSGLIQLATAEFSKDAIVESHHHNTMTEIFYLEYGKIEARINDELFYAAKGDLLVVKNKVEHSFKFIEDTKLVYLGLEENS